MSDYVTREELQRVIDGLKTGVEGAIIIGQIAKRFAMTLAVQSPDIEATISALEKGLEDDTTSFLFSGWTDEQIRAYRESYLEHVSLLRRLRS